MRHTDTNTYGDADRYPNADCDSYSYSYANCNTERYGYSYVYSAANAHAKDRSYSKGTSYPPAETVEFAVMSDG